VTEERNRLGWRVAVRGAVRCGV